MPLHIRQRRKMILRQSSVRTSRLRSCNVHGCPNCMMIVSLFLHVRRRTLMLSSLCFTIASRPSTSSVILTTTSYSNNTNNDSIDITTKKTRVQPSFFCHNQYVMLWHNHFSIFTNSYSTIGLCINRLSQ